MHPKWIGYEWFKEKGWILPDGSCTNYDRATRRCRIYETRPDFCSVVKEYDIVKPPVTMPQWFLFVEQCCDEVHEEVYGAKRERGTVCSHRSK